jgi:hypothetical protein
MPRQTGLHQGEAHILTIGGDSCDEASISADITHIYGDLLAERQVRGELLGAAG